MKQLNGESISLAAAKHHIMTVVFASATAPAFRDHAAALNALYEKYVSRGVEFLVIYTKEQHPVGGWELQRNKDDNINVPLAKSTTDRETAARKMRDALHLAEPVAIDSMDDHVASAYGVNQDGAGVRHRPRRQHRLPPILAGARHPHPRAGHRPRPVTLVPRGLAALATNSLIPIRAIASLEVPEETAY